MQLEGGQSNGLSVFFKMRLVAPLFPVAMGTEHIHSVPWNDWDTFPALNRKQLLWVKITECIQLLFFIKHLTA